MVVYPNKLRERFSNINIFIEGRQVTREPHVKILGVYFDENLNWHKHVQTLLRGLRFQYRSFSRSIKYFDMDTKNMLYNAALASRFNYADCIWNDCTKADADRLQSVQNMSVRRMVNAKPLESAKPILGSLEMLSSRSKRLLRSLVLLYKLRNGMGPSTLSNELESFANSSELTTRRNTDENFFIPAYNTDYRGKSYFIRTIKAWNELPSDIKTSSSCSVFKNKVYRLLLEVEPDGAVMRPV